MPSRNNSRVLITGINGQDGSLLAKHLVNEGFEVHGTFRSHSQNPLWRLQELDILDKLTLINLEIGEFERLPIETNGYSFQHIFHLAGSSFTFSSNSKPTQSFVTNTLGAIQVCEFARHFSADATVLLAGSSEIFGSPLNKPNSFAANSKTSHKANNIYGLSHSSIMDIASFYTSNFSLNICNPILFNHESDLRSEYFLSRKLTIGIAHLLLDPSYIIHLGNINSKKDWGSASEFVKFFYLLAKKRICGSLPIGTGKLTSVREAVFQALQIAGFHPQIEETEMDYQIRDHKTGRILVISDSTLQRKVELDPWFADTTEIYQSVGLAPTITLLEVLPHMIKKDIQRMRALHDG
jgi:GDPmannose 4,6-dehydratase